LDKPVADKDDDKANKAGGKLRAGFFGFFRVTSRGEHGEAGADNDKKQDQAGNNKNIGEEGRDESTNVGKVGWIFALAKRVGDNKGFGTAGKGKGLKDHGALKSGMLRMSTPINFNRKTEKMINSRPMMAEVIISLPFWMFSGLPAEVIKVKAPKSMSRKAKPAPMEMARVRMVLTKGPMLMGRQPRAV